MTIICNLILSIAGWMYVGTKFIILEVFLKGAQQIRHGALRFTAYDNLGITYAFKK